MNFYIRKLDQRRFDVFEGNQWSSWSRLKGGRKGVFVSDGLSLPYHVVKQLAAQINPALDTQTIVVQ